MGLTRLPSAPPRDRVLHQTGPAQRSVGPPALCRTSNQFGFTAPLLWATVATILFVLLAHLLHLTLRPKVWREASVSHGDLVVAPIHRLGQYDQQIPACAGPPVVRIARFLSLLGPVRTAGKRPS